jgi:hypothetical protein
MNESFSRGSRAYVDQDRNLTYTYLRKQLGGWVGEAYLVDAGGAPLTMTLVPRCRAASH